MQMAGYLCLLIKYYPFLLIKNLLLAEAKGLERLVLGREKCLREGSPFQRSVLFSQQLDC